MTSVIDALLASQRATRAPTDFMRYYYENQVWQGTRNAVSSAVYENLSPHRTGRNWNRGYNRRREGSYAMAGSLIRSAFRTGDASDLFEGISQVRRGPHCTDWNDVISNFSEKHGEPDYYTCSHCGQPFGGDPEYTTVDSEPLCGSCVDDYRYSECMGGYIPEDSAWAVYFSVRAASRGDPDDWCTRSFGRDEFYYHPDGSSFVDSDTHSELSDDEEEEHGVIRDYHEGEDIGHIPSTYDKGKVWMGLELEIECDGDRPSVAQLIHDKVNTDRQYVRFEYDGSLSRGFEMITGYTGLDTHEKWLKRFSEVSLRGCKSHNTDTCGLHVHIDKKNMTPFEAARLMLFIHDPANEKLIRAVARRYGRGSGYAKVVNKTKSGQHVVHTAVEIAKNTRWRNLKYMNEDRYEALNFHPERTIEYRLFRGTLKTETIMACLEFTWLSYWFARETGIGKLKTEDFIRFICLPKNKRESRYLRNLLTAKGIMPTSTPKVHIEAEAANDDSSPPPEPRLRRCERERQSA